MKSVRAWVGMRRARPTVIEVRDYLADPDAYDNKGFLKNAPTEEVRQRIIDGRTRHLRKEIQTFHDNIAKINRSVC